MPLRPRQARNAMTHKPARWPPGFPNEFAHTAGKGPAWERKAAGAFRNRFVQPKSRSGDSNSRWSRKAPRSTVGLVGDKLELAQFLRQFRMVRHAHSPGLEVKVTVHSTCTRSTSLHRFAVAILGLTALAIILLSAPALAASDKNLPPTYRHWIHQEVNYIITRAERNEFLELKTDDERDKFIERFW